MTSATPLIPSAGVAFPVAIPSFTTGIAVQFPAIDCRVLHLVNGEHFAGAERVQSHLGRCLPQFGVAAEFACLKPGRFAALLDQQAGGWGQRHEASMASRFDLRVAWRIAELVGTRDFDLLHAHTPRTAMIASLAARLADVPWVYHVHSPAAQDSSRPLINRVNAAIERAALIGGAHWITVSESLRDHCLRSGWDADRLTVVHNGVPAVRPPRASIPVPHGRWLLGMVALMRPRKGLEVALETVAKLHQRGHQVVLRCIGPFETPEYEAEIRSRIESLQIQDHVELTGFCADVPTALAALDALVLPSLYGEGLPMVVLEAMAAAVPVVATRVEGTPEAIRDGIEGLLAEPRDVLSLTEKIESLVTGRYDWVELAEAAQRRHRDHFSDTAMARRTAAVYRRVLASPSKLCGAGQTSG